ncbi:GntR family transcriptional regulator [Roseicyclus marinus]|uniref:GntR family transcriptional regulator n=1 Tax=Roseicyclus marinus TaxID=2161673 RepID=UPI002410580C|nr:GntR family transcriptional regulator [Roseicyclus marinus]MDG3040282.1 GntR family transcriptional regulator [Roseicyclus marinus]
MPDTAPQDPLDRLDVPPVDPARPVADQIHAGLKSAILRGLLPPGCLVSETEVGQRFGASRTPVRDAFTRLREDGLIVTWPSRGSYVAAISEGAILQAQFLREALELAHVARLCEIGLAPDIQAALADNLRAQAEAATGRDTDRFQSLDDAFHAGLARATGFDRAETLLVREKSALDRLRILSLAEKSHMARLLDDHGAILSAILDRDADRAGAAMRAHLRVVLTTLADLKTRHATLFDDPPRSN